MLIKRYELNDQSVFIKADFQKKNRISYLEIENTVCFHFDESFDSFEAVLSFIQRDLKRAYSESLLTIMNYCLFDFFSEWLSGGPLPKINEDIVCHCFGIPKSAICHLTNLQEVENETLAGLGCGSCKEELKKVLIEDKLNWANDHKAILSSQRDEIELVQADLDRWMTWLDLSQRVLLKDKDGDLWKVLDVSGELKKHEGPLIKFFSLRLGRNISMAFFDDLINIA